MQTIHGQELRKIILLHLGLITFQFRFGRHLKPIIMRIFRFLDVSMTPKTNCFYFWRPQDTSNVSKRSSIFWEGHRFLVSLKLSEGGGRTIPTILKMNMKILNMVSISWNLNQPWIISGDPHLGILIYLGCFWGIHILESS